MNTYHPSALPLCRPKMLPDEWVETYLFRVARANGIRRPRLSDVERLRPMLPATASSRPDGYPIWSDAGLPRWSVVTRVNKIRYCPECMTESRHIRSRWRLRMFDVCTIHHIRLKDDLAEPVMTKGYRQEGRYFVSEITDEQLWSGAVCPMPSERRYVEGLWSKFERSIVGDDTPGAFEQLTHVLFLEALLDAVLTTARDLEAARLCVARSTELARLVEQYQFSLVANSDGIRDFLDQMTVASHRDMVLVRLRRMLIGEANRPTCLSTLPIADLRNRLLIGSQTSMAPADEILRSDHDHAHGYVGLKKAASIIGCTSRLLKRLIDSGVCQGFRTVRLGVRRYTLLSSQTVEACRTWLASIATPEQVMNELHIDRREFLALLSAGLLRPIAIGTYKFFRRSDLTDLCRRLEDLSRPLPPKADHLHSLLGEWIPSSGRYRATSFDVLNEAFGGKVSIFRRMDCAGLSGYFVDHTALERVRRLRRAEFARQQQERYGSGQLSLLAE